MPDIRRLTADDLPELERLFREYPHKQYQQRFQGMDAGKLAAFFLRGEQRRFAPGAQQSPDAWVAADGPAIHAFAALHDDPWHASFYKRHSGIERCARIAPFLAWRAGDADRRALLDTVLVRADAQGFRHLSVRVDAAECDLAALLTARGFYVVDSSVKLSARMKDVPDAAGAASAPGIVVRRAAAGDAEDIRRIATTSHPFNHYYNDPKLDRRDVDALFLAWVDRCLGGLASDIFVADDAGRVLGFVIYITPTTLNQALGTRLVVLDFVCLDRRAQGGGLGRHLLARTLRDMADRFDLIELRTSANNYPALACYRDLGFRIVGCDYILHRVS